MTCRTLRPASVASTAVLILGVLLSTSLVYPAVGVRYTPGLLVGDSAFYSLSGNFGYIPTEPVTQMKVLGVTGTNVSVSFVNFYPDGHISPNHQIYNGWSNVTIVSQQSFPCGGVSRTTVGIEFFPPNGNVILIWDQATGALCYYSTSNNQNGERLAVNMINSTLWSKPTVADPFTVGAEISALLGLPLVAIIMFVYFRRRRARK